jgi:hypothetical protein
MFAGMLVVVVGVVVVTAVDFLSIRKDEDVARGAYDFDRRAVNPGHHRRRDDLIDGAQRGEAAAEE